MVRSQRGLPRPHRRSGVEWAPSSLTRIRARCASSAYVLVASLVFFGSGLFAFILSYSDSRWRVYSFRRSCRRHRPGGMPDYQGNQLPTGIMAPLSAFIMQNNIKGFTASRGRPGGVYTPTPCSRTA